MKRKYYTLEPFYNGHKEYENYTEEEKKQEGEKYKFSIYRLLKEYKKNDKTEFELEDEDGFEIGPDVIQQTNS